MTLAEMQRLADADQKSRNARQHMAGAYAAKALRAIAAKDWDGATQDAIRACERSTNYAPLLTLIDAARRGSITSKARAAASRANGAKGGRPGTLPVPGYDGKQLQIELEGFVWKFGSVGEYSTMIGSRRFLLRATPGAGPENPALYRIGVTNRKTKIAHGVCGIMLEIQKQAGLQRIPLVYHKDGEIQIAWTAPDRLSDDEIVERTVAAFAAEGFAVEPAAVRHNLDAWHGDLKSGFRGEKFHLFTPCGCNPLSFRASPIRDEHRDWQTTYAV